MELRQIKYFIEVAKHEHVTEAATNLHIAQSAISRQIAKLEDELEIELFIRDGRNVKLTTVGKIFLEHAERAMSELEKAVQSVQEYLNPDIGMIKIGFPNSLTTKTLPMVISAFREQHPNIGYKFRQGSSRELRELVEKGEIDLAFVSPVPQNDEKVEGHVFFTERMMALLHYEHPLADNHSISLDQLRDEAFVLFRQGFDLRNTIVSACSKMGFKPKITFEGEDIYTIKGIVGAGLGVSVLPEITISDYNPIEVVAVHINEPVITRNVGIILPSNRKLPPSEMKFYEFLKEYYATLTDVEK